MNKRKKTVRARELSNWKMTAGNETRYATVIDECWLLNWVGNRWVVMGLATDEDREKYPEVVR